MMALDPMHPPVAHPIGGSVPGTGAQSRPPSYECASVTSPARLPRPHRSVMTPAAIAEPLVARASAMEALIRFVLIISKLKLPRERSRCFATGIQSGCR
jgi:hypothetical protein